jgi:hypothetical protein
MNMRTVLFGLAIAAVLASVVILILIMAALDRRGHKTNILLARLYFFKYLAAYKEATTKETGRPGRLYYLYIMTINVAWLAAVAGLLSPR